MSQTDLRAEQEKAARLPAGVWDHPDEDERQRLHHELIKTLGLALQVITSAHVETVAPAGVTAPPANPLDPALSTKYNSQGIAQERARWMVREGQVSVSQSRTVLWATQQFTLATQPRSADDEALLSRAMAALALNPGTLLGEHIQDSHRISCIGTSSADYIAIPTRPHEFILQLEALNQVPVRVTVTDLAQSAESPLKLIPPQMLSCDLLGAQIGKARTDKSGRRITANRRLMDDGSTPVMSILVLLSPNQAELQQKVGSATAFKQGIFSRGMATPRLEQQVWGLPPAPDTNSRESRPQTSPLKHVPGARRPHGALEHVKGEGSTIVQAPRATGRLTEHEKEFIKARMDRDTPTAIANDLSRSLTTVRDAISRFRAEREGKATRRLTRDEMAEIQARMDYQTAAKIARDLKRAQKTVHRAVERLRAEAEGRRATGPLTEHEEEIIKARMHRDTTTNIANHLNREQSTVHAAIQRLRAAADGRRLTGRLTEHEKETIKARMDRDTPTKIANDLNRNRLTVQAAIQRLCAEAGGRRATGRLTEREEATDHPHEW